MRSIVWFMTKSFVSAELVMISPDGGLDIVSHMQMGYGALLSQYLG
jgi:hypothetical protein